MSSVVMHLQSRPAQWTDGLTLNTHGVPLGNLRNVLYAAPCDLRSGMANSRDAAPNDRWAQ